MFRRNVPLIALLSIGLLAGCSSAPETSGPMPEGTTLVSKSALAQTRLETARFTFGLTGIVPGVQVRSAEGAVTTSMGTARGKAQVDAPMGKVDGEFLADRLSTTITDGRGVQTRLGAPHPDLTTLLVGNNGVRALLLNSTDVHTEGKEALNGQAAYRVDANVGQPSVNMMLPGAWAGAHVKFWISEEARHDLLRVWLQLPPRQPNQGAVTVEVALKDQKYEEDS